MQEKDIIASLKPNIFYFIANILISMLLVVAGLYFAINDQNMMAATCAAVAVALFIYPLYIYVTRSYFIYKDRVEIVFGIFNIDFSRKSIPVDRILMKEVIYPGIVSRILNIGEIDLANAATETIEMRLKYVYRPKDVIKILDHVIALHNKRKDNTEDPDT